MFQTTLTNYKKLKIAATQQLYKQKQMKIFPSFFTSYSSFIRNTSAIISKYLANMALCVWIKTRKSALPQQKTR